MRLQLDPNLGALANWNLSASLQPCQSYGGPAGRLASAGAWTGITCSDLASATVATPPTFTLRLPGNALNGTVPWNLQELRTATTIDLSNNRLNGTLPAQWLSLTPIAWNVSGPATLGFDRIASFNLAQVQIQL